MMEKNYDFIIVGAGVSGLSAAMYGARMGLKTLVLGASNGSELPLGGVITTTDKIENYPGFQSISGLELANRIKEHALSYNAVEAREEKVESVEKKNKEFIIKTSEGEYFCKTVLFASGTRWKKLDVPGAKEFENKGVAYCALCDAPLFKNKVVAVVGGSDSAVKYALLLTKYAKKIYIINITEKITAEPVNKKLVEKNEKIEIINNNTVTEIKGEGVVKSVLLKEEYNGKKELLVDGVFVAIGHVVLSEIAKRVGVKLNEKEEIIISKNCETNVPGVYAAGDVTDNSFKQAITGVAEGCTAAYFASEYIKKNFQ